MNNESYFVWLGNKPVSRFFTVQPSFLTTPVDQEHQNFSESET